MSNNTVNAEHRQTRPIIVFDANETLLDLNSLEPHSPVSSAMPMSCGNGSTS